MSGGSTVLTRAVFIGETRDARVAGNFSVNSLLAAYSRFNDPYSCYGHCDMAFFGRQIKIPVHHAILRTVGGGVAWRLLTEPRAIVAMTVFAGSLQCENELVCDYKFNTSEVEGPYSLKMLWLSHR
jgi:hypothetical protein